MLSEIIRFVKEFIIQKFNDIMLVIIVCLMIMLAFSLGYIIAKQQSIKPIQIEKTQN